ncbi:hypothetical protein EI94DRAFT_1833613, partial [Lactarius quietus]
MTATKHDIADHRSPLGADAEVTARGFSTLSRAFNPMVPKVPNGRDSPRSEIAMSQALYALTPLGKHLPDPLPHTMNGKWISHTVGVPIVVVCTKSDLISITPTLSVRTSSLVSHSRDMAVADGASLFYKTPQLTTLNVPRQYMPHVLYVPPAAATDGALDSTAAPILNPFLLAHKPHTLDHDHILAPA